MRLDYWDLIYGLDSPYRFSDEFARFLVFVLDDFELVMGWGRQYAIGIFLNIVTKAAN